MRPWILLSSLLVGATYSCIPVIAQTELPALSTSAPSDSPLPPTVTAAPPPDPETPAWGGYLAPQAPYVAPRRTEYNIVGPPEGITQQIEGQDFQAAFTDPNTVLDRDRQIGQVIDLFRPDGFGPIGVFGDHTLPVGTIHVSYRYLQNSYDQNYVGSHRISVNQVAAQYAFAPSNMMQNSQVALVEYGVSRDLTMMAYLPFQHNEINSQAATGEYKATFTNPGDIHLMALLAVYQRDSSQTHLNLGISVPVGLLESQAVMPSPTAPNLPYQIRTSSGTYDLLVGATHRVQTDFWTWGSQVNLIIPTGKNTLGYELGNQAQLTSWLSRRLSERWSASGRLDAHFIGNIRGADVRLDPTLSPANLNTTQGGDYLNGLLGLNYYLSRPESRIFEQRFFIESGVPFYQSLNGPQLGISWILNAGWGMSF